MAATVQGILYALVMSTFFNREAPLFIDFNSWLLILLSVPLLSGFVLTLSNSYLLYLLDLEIVERSKDAEREGVLKVDDGLEEKIFCVEMLQGAKSPLKCYVCHAATQST